MNPANRTPNSSSIHCAGLGFAATENVKVPGDDMTFPEIRAEKLPAFRLAFRLSR